MKKLFLALVLAVGLVFTGTACSVKFHINKTVEETEQYRTITREALDGATLDVVIPVDWPNFFVHPYKLEMMMPITNEYVVIASRHKDIFEDVYVVGVVTEEDNSVVVNILRGIDDTFWLYDIIPGEKGVRPHQVTREEFMKNVERWEDRTKGPYGWGG